MVRSWRKAGWAVGAVAAGLVLLGGVAVAWPLWGGFGAPGGVWGTMHGGWGGMMGSGPMGNGMMGTGMMGGGMMGQGGWWDPAVDVPLSIGEAAARVQQALRAWGLEDLKVGHIMEFDNGFYVVVKRPDGRGAFELLVDRYRGTVHPEPGPNMMWNTEYGHMGPRAAAGRPALGPDKARAVAQEYLDRQLPGSRTGELTEFPGYYTLDVVRDGRTVGMLSVHAYTGQVWYHQWHGNFIQESEGIDEEHARSEAAT